MRGVCGVWAAQVGRWGGGAVEMRGGGGVGIPKELGLQMLRRPVYTALLLLLS